MRFRARSQQATRRPPQGRESSQQRPVEHPNALRQLPQTHALLLSWPVGFLATLLPMIDSEPDLQALVEAMAPENDLLVTIEDLVTQFAHQIVHGGVPAYSTYGLSALEGAFAVLGWDDPHPAPEMACDEPGCSQWATCGIPTADGYRQVCGAHYQQLVHHRDNLSS